MKSSLIPEKPILVYPSLASTLGLDESVMLSCLADIAHMTQSQTANGFHWYLLSVQTLEQAMPFWDRRDLQRVSTALREKGVIVIASPPLLQQQEFQQKVQQGLQQNETQSGTHAQDVNFKFAFNEKYVARQTQPSPQQNAQTTHYSPPIPAHMAPLPPAGGMAAPVTSHGKNFIPNNWKPDQVTLDQLAQLNINADFAFRQVPEFVTYWRERNEAHRSWGQKFISHTIQRWRTFEAQENRKNKATVIHSNWMPNEDCVNDLMKRGIPQQFIMDHVREFISFWQATGERHIAWQSKFIQRVQSSWAELEARKNVATKEFSIFTSWRPSSDALDVMINQSQIPSSFIDDSIAEFIIYWQEKGTVSSTWNSMFIKHVRLQWHRYQHALDNNINPQPISPDWQPSQDVFDILKLANIEQSFARELIPEFVLYWRDRNEIHRSWNTRFLQHAKRTWAARHQLAVNNANTNALRSTREISLEEELNDTSWAD